MLDRPVQIAKDLTRRASDLRIHNDFVMIECNQNDTMVGSLHIPLEASEVYPTSGWVFALGPKVKEKLSVGDFVLIEEEGTDVGMTYYDVFEVTLRLSDGSFETIRPYIEVEPVLREHVPLFRRGGGPDVTFRTKDTLTDEGIRFNCSDVVSWQFGEVANPSYDLTYIPVHMFYFLNEDGDQALFYITKPGKIIANVRY